MQEKRKKNEPIFALWHFGGGKCRKCKAKRDENFYIGGIACREMDYTGMACRGKEEDDRTGTLEKAVFPIRQTWRMQKRKHRMKESAALKYRERDEEEKPLGGGTPSGKGRDTI